MAINSTIPRNEANRIREQAQAIIALAPAIGQTAHAAWNAALDVIEAHAKAKRPPMKVFEVHHINDVARLALLTALVNGQETQDGLKQTALEAVGLA